MRTPKAPPGFVPVDSEEARKIDGKTLVNYVTVDGDKWCTQCTRSMENIRLMERDYPEDHRHVQLPPPVEWEEVWGWTVLNTRPQITRYGIIVEELYWRDWSDDTLDTIVRALNEMEGDHV